MTNERARVITMARVYRSTHLPLWAAAIAGSHTVPAWMVPKICIGHLVECKHTREASGAIA